MKVFQAGLWVCLTGCLNSAPLPPAPEDLEGNVAWLWNHGLESSNDELADALAKLEAAGAAVRREGPMKGELKVLSAEQLTGLGLSWEPNLARARGMYIATALPCTLSQVEDVLRSPNQMEKYPGTYERYERTLLSENEWSAEIDSKILVDAFTHTLRSTLRKEEKRSSLLLRTFMPGPAVFKSGSTTFEQNYELEMFVPRDEVELLHVYGVWRDVQIPLLGLSTRDNNMLNAIIDNMLQRDARTRELCLESSR